MDCMEISDRNLQTHCCTVGSMRLTSGTTSAVTCVRSLFDCSYTYMFVSMCVYLYVSMYLCVHVTCLFCTCMYLRVCVCTS